MTLFVITQSQNKSYDTYDSAVVAAEDYDSARKIHPDSALYPGVDDSVHWLRTFPTWASSPHHVEAKYLGEAAKGIESGVICADFRAG